MGRLLPIIALVLGLGLVGVATVGSPASPAPVPVSQSQTYEDGSVTPTDLILWHYEAEVVPVEMEGTTITPPSDPQVLGWWGAEAGADEGTTLLTGHTVNGGGGMFDDLEDIPVGTVGTVSGVAYEVATVEVMSEEELAAQSEELFSQSGEHKLVLVTCEGFNPATGEYDDNVVVTAYPV